MRHLLAAGVVVAMVAHEGSALCCSVDPGPQANPFPPGHVERVYASDDGGRGDTQTVPRNVGIPLFVDAGVMTDDELRAKVRITVRPKSGAAPLEGAARRVSENGGGQSVWSWIPASRLPIGPLALDIAFGGTSVSQEVIVEDRALEVPELPVSITTTRQWAGDPAAPKIRCEPRPTSCGLAPPSLLPSRVVADPTLRVGASSPPEYGRFIRSTARVFGRRAGVESPLAEALPNATGILQLKEPSDEYCVTLTTRLLDDPATEKRSTTCIPNDPAIFVIREDEQSVLVKGQLASCSTVEFPPGLSAENPTSPSEADGCSLAPRARGRVIPVLAGLLGLALLRRVVRRRSFPQ